VPPPSRPADSPLNIVDRRGVPIRNDNTTTPAYLGTGTGNTYPEQYTAVDPANALSADPIAAGGLAILKNKKTGKYCQLVPVPTAPSMQVRRSAGNIWCFNLYQVLACCLLPAPPKPTAMVGVGWSCSMAPANLSVVQGMQCDLDTPNGATSFTYTGYGIVYNGTPLVPEVSGCMSREQCLAP
jgi:hypothetical protein